MKIQVELNEVSRIKPPNKNPVLISDGEGFAIGIYSEVEGEKCFHNRLNIKFEGVKYWGFLPGKEVFQEKPIQAINFGDWMNRQ